MAVVVFANSVVMEFSVPFGFDNGRSEYGPFRSRYYSGSDGRGAHLYGAAKKAYGHGTGRFVGAGLNALAQSAVPRTGYVPLDAAIAAGLSGASYFFGDSLGGMVKDDLARPRSRYVPSTFLRNFTRPVRRRRRRFGRFGRFRRY